jgi:hypothetical protein
MGVVEFVHLAMVILASGRFTAIARGRRNLLRARLDCFSFEPRIMSPGRATTR